MCAIEGRHQSNVRAGSVQISETWFGILSPLWDNWCFIARLTAFYEQELSKPHLLRWRIATASD